MLEPHLSISTRSDYIQYLDTSFLPLVVSCTAHMEPVHAIKLRGMKATYESRYPSYFTGSEWKSLTGIFKRYKDILLERLQEDIKQKFLEALQEADAFDKYTEKLQAEMQQQRKLGNLRIVKRPEDGSRYV